MDKPSFASLYQYPLPKIPPITRCLARAIRALINYGYHDTD